MSDAARSRPLISVCVATYRRPDSLRRLLQSLAAQETDGAFDVEWCIADNAADRVAEPIVREFAAIAVVHYAVEPEKNISLARNKSVSLARGDFMAFTDDDLHAEPRWLANLWKAAGTHRADVVHGPVVSRFAPNAPLYLRTFSPFTRPNPETGAVSGYVFATANALVRRSVIDSPTPFDAAFGRTGGEDMRFFLGVIQRGFRMVWCREAVVVSDVPQERARLSWLLQREFRNGNMRRRLSHSTGGAGRFFAVVRVPIHVLVGLARLSASWFAPAQRQEGQRAITRALLTIAWQVGGLAALAGIRYEEYSDSAPPYQLDLHRNQP